MSIDIAKLATGNPELLKELSVEEVLELHPLIDIGRLEFQTAEKTKPIKARPISTVLIDGSVMAKVLLATLEGQQVIKANSFICWGVDNDVWQQTEEKLHQKYTIDSVDPDGWFHCTPKPENETDAAQVGAESQLGPYGGWSVTNPNWGDERVLDGKQVYLHYGVANDYVMRVPTDPDDTYRIALKMFKNTYEIKS